jgi:hypothetical protein
METMMASLFFSYSHVDGRLRDQLEIHLSQLRRDGLIDAWHDRRILAGSNLDDSINEQLEAADIVLLLVSPDFINSDYCYSREMALALERQARKEAHVIAVILRACDWTSSPLGKLLAVPTDARAVTSWPNQDEAFTDVAKAIRKVVNSLAPNNAVAAPTIRPAPVASAAAPAGASAVPAPEPLPRSSNLRLKKEFSDLDRDVFIKDSFDFMARFFEGSLQELEARHPDFKGRFERIDSRKFTASIYKGGKAVAQCTVALGAFGRATGEITYSDQISTHTNSYNEALTVGADTQQLFFKPMMNMTGGNARDQLSAQGAAEYYWSRLIERLQG